MVLDEPTSSLYFSDSHFSNLSSSSSVSLPSSILFDISPLNCPTASLKSKDLGNVSPDQEGIVGFLPNPSLTLTLVPSVCMYWYVLPPKTNMSFLFNFSTNFSDRLPILVPLPSSTTL